MISFVCWKWSVPGSPRSFLSAHVNVLRAMIARHYREPHRLVCVTEDPVGLDPRVVVVAPPPDHFATLLARSVGRFRRQELIGVRKDFPACWRRLWNFSRDWAPRYLGPRIFSIDIDVIVTGDLSPLVNRAADFVGWHDERFGWHKIAGGCYMLRTGSHPEVFEEFNPATSPQLAAAAGLSGSDQAWMSYKLWPPRAAWSARDGVIKINWLPARAPTLPLGTRLVFTGGTSPPWLHTVRARYPWIANFYTQ